MRYLKGYMRDFKDREKCFAAYVPLEKPIFVSNVESQHDQFVEQRANATEPEPQSIIFLLFANNVMVTRVISESGAETNICDFNCKSPGELMFALEVGGYIHDINLEAVLC